MQLGICFDERRKNEEYLETVQNDNLIEIADALRRS
jgi:hypothetical protein